MFGTYVAEMRGKGKEIMLSSLFASPAKAGAFISIPKDPRFYPIGHKRGESSIDLVFLKPGFLEVCDADKAVFSSDNGQFGLEYNAGSRGVSVVFLPSLKFEDRP